MSVLFSAWHAAGQMDGESEEEQESAGTGEEEEEDGDESDLVTGSAFRLVFVAEWVGRYRARSPAGRRQGLKDAGRRGPSLPKGLRDAPQTACGCLGWAPAAQGL